jgi:ribosomal protein S18 acetylase RimI-like enzyme
MTRETKALPVRIRLCVRRDFPDLHTIEADAYWGGSPWNLSDIDLFNARRGSLMLVAELNWSRVEPHLFPGVSRAATSIAGYLAYSGGPRGRSEIVNVAVLPQLQRFGVGTKLVDATKRYLKPNGQTLLFANVHERNDRAIDFWKAQGFKATAIVHDPYDNGDDAFVFEYSPWVTLDFQGRVRRTGCMTPR